MRDWERADISRDNKRLIQIMTGETEKTVQLSREIVESNAKQN